MLKHSRVAAKSYADLFRTQRDHGRSRSRSRVDDFVGRNLRRAFRLHAKGRVYSVKGSAVAFGVQADKRLIVVEHAWEASTEIEVRGPFERVSELGYALGYTVAACGRLARS